MRPPGPTRQRLKLASPLVEQVEIPMQRKGKDRQKRVSGGLEGPD